MKTLSENICFGGTQGVYSHASTSCDCDMTFAVFLPEEARDGPVPVLWYLSGLTCTHEKADDAAFDLGQGAGFYVNATQAPWAKNYLMWEYISEELPALLGENFPLDMERQAICGHSMGGHGALTLAMALPQRFASVSAFAPIANPTRSDWGRKQLSAYLGNNEEDWRAHDATVMMQEKGFDGPVLIDQGTADQFLDLLTPEALAEAMAAKRQNGILRMQPGYDHSYFFISTFMEDHVAFHAEALYAR